MTKELTSYFVIAEALSKLLYPHAEVAVHDLKTGRIAAIYNNFSKRKVGGESLIEELTDSKKFPNVFPPYSKINWDGKKMKSVTATLRDAKGNAIGLFCINLDISRWEELHQFLGEWIQEKSIQKKPETLFKDDWKDKINLYVSEYLKKERTSLKALSKDKKRELIRALRLEGAFNAKNAASYVADVLDLSRATIYNYLR